MKRPMFIVTAVGLAVALAACATKTAETAAASTPAVKVTAPARRVEILVTENGFEPANVSVAKGQPVTLAFTRKTERTCATEVILQVEEGQKIERKLPLNETVEVTVTFPKSGELKYACAMDMISGVITVE